MTRRDALGGFCAALLPPEAGGPDPGALAALVDRHLRSCPVPARLGARFTAGALDAVARLRTGRRLADLDPEGRAGLLEWVAAQGRPADLALDALKALVLLAHGADAHAADLRVRSNREPPARPDADLPVEDALGWPSGTCCDAVVVGSGAGGAMVARTLARAGWSVVVVEEGRRWTVDELRHGHPLDRFAGLYRDGGATAAIGRPPVMLPLGRAVGGTTVVNSGTCYRTPDVVAARWRDDHGLALAEAGALAAHLDDVEATLGVAPVPAPVMGRNGELALAGAAELGWAARPLDRNAPGCGGCCQCAIGCPRNAKAGVHLNALPQATAAGARILGGARVLRVVGERGRAAGIVARRADGSTFTVRAPTVVVAAGATETPPLLRRSGIGGHPRLGRNLSLHPALGVAGRFGEPVVAWQGVLQSAAVEEFHAREGILMEATSTPPGMGSMTLPGFGPALLGELAASDRLATVGAMIADAPAGRVLGRGRGASPTLVRYDLAPGDARRLVRAVRLAGRLLLAAGAEEVFTGVPGVPAATNPTELADALDHLDPRRLHLAAFHPTGSAAAGADPERHPVGPTGALRGAPGVWVADAGIVPSCIGVNPQVSIMALALGVGEAVAAAG